MSSVLERRESATPRNQTAGSRLLLIGAASFAVVLLGWLAYALAHPAAYTVDPADLKVYDSGGLIIRHVSPPVRPAVPVPAVRLAAEQGRAEVHLHAVRRGLLRRHVLRPLVGPAAAVPGGEPAAPAQRPPGSRWARSVNHPGGRLPPPRGTPVALPARRHAARRRRRAAHRAGVPHHVPRAGQPAADGAASSATCASPTAAGSRASPPASRRASSSSRSSSSRTCC